LFLSYAETTTTRVLDGALCMHVDDLMGTGDVNSKVPGGFADKKKKLQESFRFRTWEEGPEQEYCGAVLKRLVTGDIVMTLEKYIKGIKPITIEKSRAKEPTAPVTQAERRQLRGLLGAMAWPTNQAAPHGQCSVSLLQGMNEPTVATLQEANKLLRFLKTNADVAIRIKRIATRMSDVVFVLLTDAAWAVRADGSSQGGYTILLCHKQVMLGEKSDFIVIDWRSWKLPRVSRSSLASEAQAAAGGADALEFAKCFWSLSLDDRRDPRADYTMQVLGPSAIVIDAKALYDAAKKEHVRN
jgi:hypothetical protein